MSKLVVALPNDAATDLTGMEMQPVKFGASGVTLCTAITDQAVGVVVKGGGVGEKSDIGIRGQFPVIAIDTITGGGKAIAPGAGGFQDTAATAQECGLGLQPGVAGDVCMALLDMVTVKQA